jgi:dihydrofolate reductase
LPGRRNYIVTRQTGPALEALRALGAYTASSVEDALAQCRAQVPCPSEVWVIGGAQIYAQAEALANWAEVTQVDMGVKGDAFAPTLGTQWEVTESLSVTTASGIQLLFQRYARQA